MQDMTDGKSNPNRSVGKVLRWVPGAVGWKWAEYPANAKGFSAEVLQRMVEATCYCSVMMAGGLVLIADDEGRLRDLPVSVRVGVGQGRFLEFFGPVAVVRARGNKYVGLVGADKEIIETRFDWQPIF